jgi:ubiquinone/menaquinone biosynthesis C-methylase UbiE
LIENVFHRYGDKPISRVLDLSCGTGNHAFPLASRGYEVVGIERSESMHAQAYNKLAHAPTKPQLSYRAGDIRNVKLESEFDAALTAIPAHDL